MEKRKKIKILPKAGGARAEAEAEWVLRRRRRHRSMAGWCTVVADEPGWGGEEKEEGPARERGGEGGAPV